VAIGLYAVPGLFDGAVRSNDEGGADNTNDGLAVVELLAVGTVGGHRGVGRVAHEIERQAVLGAECLVGFLIVWGNANYLNVEGGELGEFVVELAGLASTARRVVGGVEVEDVALSGQRGE